MNANQRLGRYGETLAAGFLLKQGYHIIQRNFRCRSGEIDIVAIKGGNLVFCEVKTRTGDSFGSPALAVTKEKISHIEKSACFFMASGSWVNYQPRIDVIEVHIKPEIAINHMIGVT